MAHILRLSLKHIKAIKSHQLLVQSLTTFYEGMRESANYVQLILLAQPGVYWGKSTNT